MVFKIKKPCKVPLSIAFKSSKNLGLSIYIAIVIFLASLPSVAGDEFVYVSNYNDSSISRINITNNNNTPENASVDYRYKWPPANQYWDGELLWASDTYSGYIISINLSAWPPSVTGRLLNPAQYVQLTPDRTRLYAVDHANDVAYVINATFNASNQPDLSILASIQYNTTTPSSTYPCDISITPDGKYAVTPERDRGVEPGKGSLVTFINISRVEELISENYPPTVDVSVSEVAAARVNLSNSTHNLGNVGPHKLTVSPWYNYKYVFVENMGDNTESIINYTDPNPNNWAEIAVINLGPFEPYTSEFTPDGNYVYISKHDSDPPHKIIVIDLVNLSAYTNISTLGRQDVITFSPDGNYSYASMPNEDKVLVISTSNHSVMETISVGDWPHGALASPPYRYRDTAPPIVTLNYPQDDKYFTSNDNIFFNVTVTDSASDWYWNNENISNVSLWFNGSYYLWHRHPEVNASGIPGTYIFNISYLNISYGTYTWNVQAFDTSGNEAWGSSNRTFTYGEDIFPPQITINSPINGTYISDNTPTLNVTEVEDNPDTMLYSLDGGSNETGCYYPCTTKAFEVNLTKNWIVGSGGDAWSGNVTLVNTTINDNGNTTLNKTVFHESELDANTSMLLHMNEGSGSCHVNDTSSNGNNGTLGGDCLGTDTPTWTTAGKFGSALDFDGVDDYVNVLDSNSLDIAGEITIMMWIYPKSDPVTGYDLIYKGNVDYTDFNYEIYTQFRKLAFDWDGGFYTTPSAVFSLNQWSHIAITYNTSVIKMYVNGTEVYSASETEPLTTDIFNLTIGLLPDGTYQFNGTIDEVHILDRALSAEEIALAYQGYQSIGYVTSTISKDAQSIRGTVWKRIKFDGDVPSGTDVSIYVNTSSDNSSWTGYNLVQANATSGTFYDLNITNQQRHARWRLVLQTNHTSITPTIYNVTMGAGLTDGQHNITVYANDTLGYNNSKTSIFTVDTILPVLNITSPSNTSYDYSNLTLNFTYNETNLDICFYNLNNATSNTTIACQNGTGIKAMVGSNVLVLYINDFAGNIGYDAAYFNVTKDTSPPIITIYSPQNLTYKTTTIDLNVSADEGNITWWYSLNSGTNTTFTPNTTITGTEGLNNVVLYANDTWGNVNSSIVWFTVDITPPSVTNLVVTPSRPEVNGLVNITANVSDNIQLDTVTVRITYPDGSAVTDSMSNGSIYNYSNFNASIYGTYSVRIIANDTAGNVNDTVNITFWAVEVYSNESVNITADETITIDAREKTDTTLDILTNESLIGAINITKSSGAPDTEKPLNSTYLASSEYAIGKYITIEVSDYIQDNLSWAIFKVYYTLAELDLDEDGEYNEAGVDIDPSTLKLYWYNSTARVWVKLLKGTLPWVYDTNVNTTANFIWANVSKFSDYSIGGSIIPAPTSAPLTTGGGYRAVLTSPNATIIITPDDVVDLIRELSLMANQFYVVKPELAGVLGALDYMPTSQDLSGKVDKETWKPVKTLEGDVYTLASEQVLTKFDKADKVIISRGDLGVDSIASIAYARALEVPILLVEPEDIPQVTNDTLKTLGTNYTIIIGGPVAVSKDVEAQLPQVLRRIEGLDRFYTAVEMALALMREISLETVVVTDGRNPDLLAVMLAAKYNAPILYVDGDEVPQVTWDFFNIMPRSVERVMLVGVSDKARGKLTPLLP